MNINANKGDALSEKSSHLTRIASGVILVAVCASLWTVARALKKPAPMDDVPGRMEIMQPAVSDEPGNNPAPAAAKEPMQRPAPVAAGGEFVTDFATLMQREQVARDTADALRRQARENPETAASEKFIKSVERGDAYIQ